MLSNIPEINADTINDIMKDALNDPSLLSTLDVNKLLNTLDDDKHDYLENKTMDSFINENNTIINELNITNTLKLKYCNKLIGYRVVDQINELHKGKYIRWYRENTQQLTNGGILVDIKFLDNGVHILCMNSMRRFIQYKFDDCITFQRLTDEEQLILLAYNYIDNSIDVDNTMVNSVSL
jgi:hypothetical protein